MAIKVAVLHDWLTGFRGGERVLEAILELFPEADIYTMIHLPGSTSQEIEKRKIHTSFLNRVPGVTRHYRKFLPLFPAAVRSLKLESSVDLVISSSHCLIKGMPLPAGTPHLSYIHSPMRYMYDQYEVYFGAHSPLSYRLGARLFRDGLVRFDLESNRQVTKMLANSQFVRQRIQKFYGIDAGVLHPFVDLADFEFIRNSTIEKEDYDIMVTAFAPNKRVDLAIETYNQIGKRLKVIGSGQEEKRLRQMAGPSVEFMGQLTRSEVVMSLAKARALIFPGIEDFGIVPLESMAAGTPVIAFREGGVLETLTFDTAIFFDSATPQGLQAALAEFEQKTWDKKKLIERASYFSKARFQEGLLQAVQEVMSRPSDVRERSL